jgi:class 3 adenylate cyclase
VSLSAFCHGFRAAPIVIVYKPVFSSVDGSFKGVAYQTFNIDSFIRATVRGVDASAYGIVWRDLSPDTPQYNTIVYQSPNIDVSSHSHLPDEDTESFFVYRRTVDVAQRRWQLKVVYVLSTEWQLTANTSAWLSALVVIGIVVTVVAVVFIKNRIKLKKQEGAAQLLRLVVPDHVSKQLASHVRTMKSGDIVLEGETLIAQNHPQVALCFIDICNFTILSSTMTAQGLVCFLDEFFTLIDNELSKYKNIVKIKTIGDAYFAVAGLQNAPPEPHNKQQMVDGGASGSVGGGVVVELDGQSKANLTALVEFCFAVQRQLAEHRFSVPPPYRRDSPLLANATLASSPETLDVERARCQQALREMLLDEEGHFLVKTRIGIHCGDVVAGVVGKKQPVHTQKKKAHICFRLVCSLVQTNETSR